MNNPKTSGISVSRKFTLPLVVILAAFLVAAYVKPGFLRSPGHLTAQELKPFEGRYKAVGTPDDFVFQITARDNSLVLKQLWDGDEMLLLPETELEFYCKERKMPMKFTKDRNGVVTEALAFGKDLWKKLKE